MAAQIICAAIIVVAAVYMFWDRHHRMKTTGQARASVDEFMNTLSEEELNASREQSRKKEGEAEAVAEVETQEIPAAEESADAKDAAENDRKNEKNLV